MSTQQKALFLLEAGGRSVVGETSIPEPGPGEVLVQIHATALNPVDWKIRDSGRFVREWPTILGSDSSGVVAKVGEGVTNFTVGDRVLHEGFFDKKGATFQQYTVVPAEVVAKLPPNLSFDDGATLPLALATAALGLYGKKAQLPERGGLELFPPWEEGGRGKYAGQPILVYGGSSSVGQIALQLAKLSGFSPIITVASKRNESFLKSIGATNVIDRTLPLSEFPNAVKAITSEPVKVAYDSISLPDTQNAVYDVLAPGGQFLIVQIISVEQAKLTGDKFIAHVFGDVRLPAQRKIGVSLYNKLTELLAVGDIVPNNVEIVPNGLAGIPDALDKLKSGVSASKLVAHPQE